MAGSVVPGQQPHPSRRIRTPSTTDTVVGDQLDADWASRILLECLALSVSAHRDDPATVRTAAVSLLAMQGGSGSGTETEWAVAHRAFHRALVRGVGAPLGRLLDPLPDHTDPGHLALQVSSGPDCAEHALITDALTASDVSSAVAVLARHLARHGLTVLEQRAHDHTPVAILRAVELVGPRRPDMDKPSGTAGSRGRFALRWF